LAHILYLNFTITSACIETNSSSSGRWLYIQVRYNVFTCSNYNKYLPEEEPSGLKHSEEIKMKILV